MENSKPAAVVSPPKPSVPAASDSIGNSLSELEESISNLTSRLVPVLRAVPEEPSTATDRASEPCEHAEHLTQHAERIGKCVSDLADLQGRLEL